ncbi:MAG TPA: heparan-alpha-glucosaminide N-acetyltransferase domain-containing protein [Methanobacterium sp.]|nr:heparan-alpha-glucosaminide N-acetyltransferase domain-containing protein [Methanobacterium sp.]
MATKKRVISLDIFRGLTVAAMIFVNTLPITSNTSFLLKHSVWSGLTFVDLVFPFFLFIVGVSMAYSFKHRENQSQKQLWGHFIFRVVALFAIGLFLNWIGGGLPLRIPGVLQLIALASLFAAPLARRERKWILMVAAFLLIAQSCILLFAGAPGVTPGNFQEDGNIAGWVDVQVFGSQHLFEPETPPDFDPEGILTILTATVMVLLGLVIGKTLQIKGGNWTTIKLILTIGAALVLLGVLISPWLPIIKQLWTASFIMVTAGLAAIILAILYSYIDLMDRKSILRAAIPFGLNALILYVLSAVINTFTQKFYITTASGAPISLYQTLYQPLMDVLSPNIGAFIYALLVVIFWGIIAYLMHEKKIYIKL